jgi:monoamine oxidase
LPEKKQHALCKLEMGKVIRITLRFRECFWNDLPRGNHRSKTMEGMGFLFSQDEWFPTWWTGQHKAMPLLTGWAPFHCAERLSGRSKEFVAEQSLHTLHRLMGVSIRELKSLLEAAYCHDWQADPFSRGAYSYGKVGADGAQQSLAMPLENTLFFAGEATDITGNSGTVHAAIASGERAAVEIAQAAGMKENTLRTIFLPLQSRGKPHEPSRK